MYHITSDIKRTHTTTSNVNRVNDRLRTSQTHPIEDFSSVSGCGAYCESQTLRKFWWKFSDAISHRKRRRKSANITSFELCRQLDFPTTTKRYEVMRECLINKSPILHVLNGFWHTSTQPPPSPPESHRDVGGVQVAGTEWNRVECHIVAAVVLSPVPAPDRRASVISVSVVFGMCPSDKFVCCVCVFVRAGGLDFT